MKLVFWYEFIMRAIYNEKRLYVIPKVGCLHKIDRPGSMIAVYNETMSEKEAEWWINAAKKEYYFKQDRNKTYKE